MDPRTRQDEAIRRIEAGLENPPGWCEAAVCGACSMEVQECVCFGGQEICGNE